MNTDYRALAQPEPEGPTDEELFRLEDLRDAWNAQADAFNSWDELGLDEVIWFAQRQALARWGHPTPTPIPVSEGLPGEGDCDKERRCWWHAPETDAKCAVWCLGPGPTCRPPEGFGETHWLPAHALPLPAALGEARP